MLVIIYTSLIFYASNILYFSYFMLLTFYASDILCKCRKHKMSEGLNPNPDMPILLAVSG
jgi:hypothetical protein